MVEQWTENPRVGSSILPLGTHRSVAQLARASGLGPEGRRFESYHSDKQKNFQNWKFFCF